jgi:hypothetical protein
MKSNYLFITLLVKVNLHDYKLNYFYLATKTLVKTKYSQPLEKEEMLQG